MATVLTTLNSVFTTLMADVGDLVTFIMASGHEIALIPVGVILGYSAVKLFKTIL